MLMSFVQAKKALIASEKRGVDQYAINFDVTEIGMPSMKPQEDTVFVTIQRCLWYVYCVFLDSLVVCSSSLTRISPRDSTIKCPYCGSIAKAMYTGQLCSICDLAELGARVLGLQFRVL